MATIKVIGFGGKMYTAWYVSDEIRHIPVGNAIKHVHYTKHEYIQNLSTDIEKAKEKWGTDEVDLDLRGHTTFYTEGAVEKIEYDNETLPYGKYKGKKVTEIEDLGWLFWFYNDKWSNMNDDNKPLYDLIAEKLVASGQYKFHTPTAFSKSTDVFSIDDEIWEEEKQYIETFSKFDGTPVELTIEYNPNSNGYVQVNHLAVKFPEVTEMYYKGYPYYLPVVNGKAKRVKGKTILVTKYTVNESHDGIEIIEFEICKQ